MTTSISNDASRVKSFKLDGNAILSNSLIDQLKAVVNSVNSASEENCIVFQIIGTKDQDPQAWPGITPELSVHLISQWEQTLRQIELLNVLTCAIIERNCNECGLQLLLTTDVRIIQKDAIIQINHNGMWPGMTIHRLANQLGTSRGRRLVFFENKITAYRAFQIDLIDFIANDVDKERDSFLSSRATTKLSSIALRRSLLQEATSEPFETALGSHLAACDRLLRK